MIRSARRAERGGGLAALAVFLLVWLGASTRVAYAHGTGVSRAEYTLSGRTIHGAVVFRREELAVAFGGQAPERAVAAGLSVSADGAPCAAGPATLTDDPPDGSRVTLDFECPTAPARVTVDSKFLDRFPAGHAHFVTLVRPDGKKSEGVALLAKTDVDLEIGREKRSFFDVVGVGVEHILTGLDHLAFLLALTLAPLPAAGESSRKRVGALTLVLTAFTVGHTASLAIAALGGVSPSARFVEPAIALSISYVAFENFVVKSWRHRWAITLPFGLIHGFGFAGGLLDLAVDRSDLPRALFAFNAGVELGQLGVLSLVLPLVFLAYAFARRSDAARAWVERGRLAISGFLALMGLVWFALRVAMP